MHKLLDTHRLLLFKQQKNMQTFSSVTSQSVLGNVAS